MNRTNSSLSSDLDLVVAGLVFFEVFAPERPVSPRPGTETLLDTPIGFGLGGAINSAAAAAFHGARTMLHCPIHDEDTLIAPAIARACTSRDIVLNTWAGPEHPAVSFVHLSPEDRAFSSYADFSALNRAPLPPRTKWLHVPGLRELFALAPMLRAVQARGTRISLSSSWAPEELARLASACPCPLDLIVTNEAEVEAMFGGVERGLEGLRALSRLSVVSRGRAGLIAADPEQTFKKQAVALEPDDIVDAVGAGDALVGGVLAGLALGDDFSAALDRGQQSAVNQLRCKGGLAPARGHNPQKNDEVP